MSGFERQKQQAGLSKRRPFTFVVLSLFLFFQAATWAEDELPTVRGTVTDENLNPLAGAEVRLKSSNNSVDLTAVTGANGQFMLPHEPCKRLCLQVSPRKGSSLATASIDNISGEESRRIVVELKHGFEIHGRVVHENKGLKGLSVSVIAESAKGKAQEFVHGGGMTRTKGNGAFEITLTPGMKVLKITNERYQDLVPSFSRRLSVTADGVIPDIELPSRHEPKPVSRE
jgi:hypothetical protein